MAEQVRLQKILAEAGLGSRRDMETLIQTGDVTINGKVAKLGDKADINKDHIKVGGKLLHKPARHVVIALYKPRGVMTQPPPDAPDKGRVPTILDMIPRIKEKVKPIGRLDTDAEGIILLTNDGELLQRLIKPTFEIEKTYFVKIDGHMDEMKIKRLTYGVKIEGVKTRPAEVSVKRELLGKTWIQIKTTDARNRHIRKMMEAIGRPVDKVRRESFAGITLQGLIREQYRYLTSDEIKKLRSLVGLS